MISVRLEGGLGNQMFQYACGRALALRTGHELVLDTRAFEQQGQNTPRHFSLSVFTLAARVATTADLAENISWLDRARAKLGLRAPSALHTIREPHFHFAPDLFPAQFQRLALAGYWQSEKYFSDHAAAIRQDFTLRPERVARLDAALLERMQSTHSVSLHIRRGDYVANAATHQYHGVCSLDYYRHAAAQLAEQLRTPEFFVFTDDPAWARENLQLDFPQHLVSDGRWQDFEELTLMSRCRHHIIANSSFSWWGAWLNPRPDKIVCAPKVWFKNSPNDTRDLVPAAWRRC